MKADIQPPIPAAWASVKFNDRFVNVTTGSGYRGPRIDRAAFEAYLPPDADAETLAQSVLMALDHSRTIDIEEIPAFFDRDAGTLLYESWVADLIQRFAYKTRRALFRELMSCSVTRTQGFIKIHPTRRKRSETWSALENYDESAVVLDESCSAVELGEGLRLAMQRCE